MTCPYRTSSLLASRTRSLALSTSTKSVVAFKRSPQGPTRWYAQVGSTTYLGGPPPAPGLTSNSRATASSSHPEPSGSVRPFDAQVLSELQKAAARNHTFTSHGASSAQVVSPTPLTELVEQYMKRAGHVLGSSLPYESRPTVERRAQFATETDTDDGALVMVAHAVHDRTGKHKVAYSTGFAVHAPGMPEGQSVFVTCAHTLEEIRHHPLMRLARPTGPAVEDDQLLSGSFIISGPSATPTFRPVNSVLSAMHRGDVLLLSSDSPPEPTSSGPGPLHSLPVNPYPVHPGTRIRAHFVADKPPETGPVQDREGWTPWVGGTWRKWAKGTVVGYRDYAGREAKPGTYDSLAHLHFMPPPTPGSSGGPIIDEESGSVIGVILGTQLVNQVEGVRGWGVPAEMIFEMFSLPGLKLKSQQ